MPLRREEADKLIDTIRGFVEGGQRAQAAVEKLTPKRDPHDHREDMTRPNLWGPGDPVPPAFDKEALYQEFKARLIQECSFDPTLLHLLTQTPEIIVGYERTVEQVDGTTLRGRVVRLISAGYFKEARTVGSTRRELARTGPDPGGGGSLGQHLADLVRSGLLTREGEGFRQAPGIKITEKEIRSA